MKLESLKLTKGGIPALFEQWARKDGEPRMRRVLARAQGSAPVDSGDYRRSLHVETVHTDRPVVRVVADVDHALAVEARDGTLSRAFDAAGGS